MTVTRKDLPVYFQWRAGRPRWEPGPTLRARGFKGQDLKDAAGRFLSRGAAIDMAERLNAVTRDAAATSLPAPAYSHTVAEAIGKLKATRKFRLELDEAHKGHKRRRLKKRTRDGYLMHLNLIEDWCGDQPVANVRQVQLENWYDALIETRGLAMANAIMRTFRLLLNYAKDTLEWVDRNRVAQLELEQTDGRRVVWSAEEITTFTAFADCLGWPELGDAAVVSALVGLRQADLLALPRLDLSGDSVMVTNKTGALARVPSVRHFKARLSAGRARIASAAPSLVPMTEIVRADTLRPYTDSSLFRERVRAVRLYASGFAHALHAAGIGTWPRAVLELEPMPSLYEKQWGDLRDTSVTWLFKAGCTDVEIATIQGRSLVSVKYVLDKHYLVRDDGMARSGGNKLEAFLDQAGVKW